jgi:maleylacetate reductase
MQAATQWIHESLPQRIRFGDGSVAQLDEALTEVGASRALLLAPRELVESEVGARVTESGTRIAAVFDGVAPHVPIPTVRAAVARAREVEADAVVSLGGGSSADLGKAVSLFAPGTVDLAMDVTRSVVLPHIAIPTTYSGAELTPFFGMLDPDARRKRGSQRRDLAPRGVLYDPELTLSLPTEVSAQTGVNALAHCVEIAYSPQRTPEAEAVALAGVRHIARALPTVVERPDDRGARTEMLAGACLGGRALQNGRMGAHHGLAQLVGARSGIAHGLANAVLLPHVMRFNEDAVGDALASVGEALGDADASAAVARLLPRLGLPTRLSECGVAEADLGVVAAVCHENRNVASNPKPVSEADALEILRGAW